MIKPFFLVIPDKALQEIYTKVKITHGMKYQRMVDGNMELILNI